MKLSGPSLMLVGGYGALVLLAVVIVWVGETVR
jgi:hypothetical protein